MGTAMLWFGSMGFNGGNELAVNSRTTNAVIITNLAASAGGLTWVIADMIRRRSRQISMVGFCKGSVAGLVVISPASGYVTTYFSILFGVLGELSIYKNHI